MSSTSKKFNYLLILKRFNLDLAFLLYSVSSVQSPDKIKPFQVSESVALDSSLQLITLNSEEDFPNGSWLGDASSTKCRVRCPIPEEYVLFLVNITSVNKQTA